MEQSLAKERQNTLELIEENEKQSKDSLGEKLQLIEKLKESKQELEDLKNSQSQLDSTLKTKIVDASTEILRLKNEIYLLEAEVKEIETEKVKLAELKNKEESQLTQTIYKLETDKQTLEDEISKFLTNEICVKNSIQAQKEENSKLTKRIEELETLERIYTDNLDKKDRDISLYNKRLDDKL